MTSAWPPLLGAVVTEVAATLALKGAVHHPAWYAVVAAGYVCAFVLLTVVLRRGMALGVAYGIWGACGIAATAVLGAVLFHERFGLLTVAGIVLIIAGVLTVDLAGHDAPATDRTS